MPLFFLGIWLVAIPEHLIVELLEGALNEKGIKLKAEGFKKGLFCSFGAEKILVSNRRDAPIVTIADLDVRLDWLSLLELTPRLNLNGRINNGRVYGDIGLKGRENPVSIRGDNVHIKGLPFLERSGIIGDGVLALNFQSINNRGELRFSINDAQFKSIHSTDTDYLPLHLFQRVKGVLIVKQATINVQSLTLEGRGVYIRIKGDIGKNKPNMKVELMMDSSFEWGPFLQGSLEQYKVSPGYYILPSSQIVPSLQKWCRF